MWTQAELEQGGRKDRNTRKIITMTHALYSGSNVDRLYLGRKIGECGILQVHQIFEEEKGVLKEYLKDIKENALKLVYQEGLMNTKEAKLSDKEDQMKVRKET